ncbi:alpha/beta fold hydrolase [Ruegeria atlantica]|uniref:Sigma factor SigB regulation protein RsbQ n=1 Tax=Ruegeria atlantica TaxID=81569 RepID=A0A0P1EN79_9RHOB|nr:alpha/beta hydrolase [Ruegeria atlantica]CUH42742.1 Sigma factor SigB regulation protein RsbQ [Ruegeria atlantica]
MSISVNEGILPKNGRIDVIEAGNPESDRQLVLLHGLGSTSEQFSPLIELTDHGAHLILFTFPGHDRNIFKDPKLETSFEGFCNLVIEACDALDIQSAKFCGISMGSAISLKVAVRRPDLCDGLIVVRPAWLTEDSPANLKLIGLIAKLFEEHSADEVLELLEADPDFQEIEQDVPGAAESLRACVTRPLGQTHASVLAAIFRDAPFRRLNELRNVRCPAVVIGTNADPLHPVELARQTANALPDARLEILPPKYLDPEAYDAAFVKVVGDVLNISNGDMK